MAGRCVVLLGLLSSFTLFGRGEGVPVETLLKRAQFPENDGLRRTLAPLFEAPLREVLESSARPYSQVRGAQRVRFEVRRTPKVLYLLFLNGESENTPLWGRGHYVVERDLATGELTQFKVFLQDNPDSYVRVFPHSDGRSRLSLVLLGRLLHEEIFLPISFRLLLTSPFAKLMNLSEGQINWRKIFPDLSASEWKVTAQVVNNIRSRFQLGEEGASARGGGKVSGAPFSRQFSCVGFVKWVADAVYQEREGRDLPLEKLRRKHLGSRGTGNPWSRSYEKERDPFFGLDWVRNIAQILGGFENETTADVDRVSFFSYIPNVGFPVKDLRALFYLLAVENPGEFYLGSISSEYGENPELRQHHHVTAIFPYFLTRGEFRVRVLDTGSEISLEELERRYTGSFIHLSRILLKGRVP